ncbi:MAG TPA: BrnA antitoxin family protein [Burkholderiales bacterium]|nr:BrnA antitoxin family protein [Burkholderiales bacterium]
MHKRAAGSAAGRNGKASTAGRPQARTRRKPRLAKNPASPSPIDKTAVRGKTRLTMYLDMAVVEHFRSRAGGRGYQTLINEALRRAIEQENLESVLRRVIREEARPHPAKGKS